MNKTRPESARFLALFLFLGLTAFVRNAAADDYFDARADLVAAYQAQDFPAMRLAAERALQARPAFAGALFNLAFAEVLDGDAQASLATLTRLLEQKIDMGVADIEEFSPLKALRDWPAYSAAIDELYVPVGEARVAHRYSVGDFIPEGIAVAENAAVFLGSIRHGDIVRIGDRPVPLLHAADGPHWSVFGMRLASGTLWYVSSAIDEYANLQPGDVGKSGLFAVNTMTGEIEARAMLPATGNKQVLGDLAIADADTIYLADQADGVIYRYSVSTNELSTFVERGSFGSPQGLVLDASGGHLYVADYVGGLFRISLASAGVERITGPVDVSLYGIDGLYRHGNSLIAIQNGIQPNRVVRFDLSDEGNSVTASRILAMSLDEFDEPNLGEVVGDRFLFIANSHWSRFDGDGNLPADMEGPIVLEISLDK